jgi:hypothetical protein
MQLWNEIRHKVLVEDASKRSIRRDYGIGSEVLEKILIHPEPPGYRQRIVRPKTKLGPLIGVVDAILEDDKEAPPKQRHTARRIFERLRDEHGYAGSEVEFSSLMSALADVVDSMSPAPGQRPGEGNLDRIDVFIADRMKKEAIHGSGLRRPYRPCGACGYFVTARSTEMRATRA